MKKMSFNKLIYVFIALSILLTGCQSEGKEKTLTKYSQTTLSAGFDTFVQLIAYCESEEQFNDYFKVVCDEFLNYHQHYDIYHTYDGINNLKTINDLAGVAPVKVDDEIIEMLDFARKEQSIEDEFDISAGSLLKVWHNYRENGKDLNENYEYGPLPTDEELEEASQYIGMDFVEVDHENKTVFLTDPHVSLDVGGLAKGYATEMVAKKLTEMGLEHGAISAGGNLRTIGFKPDGTAWRTSIVNPNNDGSYVTVFDTPLNSSVVTSGDYQNYFLAEDGNKYHHICDLDTLGPVHYYKSVTILTNHSGRADLLSTTLFNEPLDEALETIERFRKEIAPDTLEVVFVTEKTNDYGYKNCLTDDNYNIYYTDGLAENIELMK